MSAKKEDFAKNRAENLVLQQISDALGLLRMNRNFALIKIRPLQFLMLLHIYQKFFPN